MSSDTRIAAGAVIRKSRFGVRTALEKREASGPLNDLLAHNANDILALSDRLIGWLVGISSNGEALRCVHSHIVLEFAGYSAEPVYNA